MLCSQDYVCDYCSRSFIKKYNLQTHIENCHINSSCCCEICGMSIGSPLGLQLHYSRGHNNFNQPKPECDICGRIFPRKRNIKLHIITAHLQGVGPQIKCNICLKSYTTERYLRKHLNRSHNPNIGSIQCDLCDKVFTNMINLNRYIKRGEFKCNICPRVYSSSHSLKRHILSTHVSENQDEFKCEYWDKVIKGKENFESHIPKAERKFHKTESDSSDDDYSESDSADGENDEFTCEECSKYFEDQLTLKKHVKTEHSFQTFYEFCKKQKTKVFLSKQKLSKVTKIRKIDEWFCYNKILELKDHMRSMHNVKYCLSTCNVCFTKFFSQEALAEHKRTCLPPDGVNSCSHCDKLFTVISSLEFHTRIFHPKAQIADSDTTTTNVNDSLEAASNFKCKDCNCLYYSDQSLKRHIKLKHTLSEIVECKICGKIYDNKYYLKSHIKKLHNTSIKCDYCKKQFKTRRTLKKHNKTKHVNLVPNDIKLKHLPRCMLCMKDYSTRITLKRHIKKFHEGFNADDLANFGSRKREFLVDCDECIKNFKDEAYFNLYQKNKKVDEDSFLFKCSTCSSSYNSLEYAIQRYKLKNSDPNKSSQVLGKLCSPEMSNETSHSEYESLQQMMESVNTTMETAVNIKDEMIDIVEHDIKTEPMSP